MDDKIKTRTLRDELKALMQAGRTFILAIEDKSGPAPFRSIDEDMEKFRWAVDRGAQVLKALKVVLVIIAVASPARSLEFNRNPDRFPSVGLHVDNVKLDGDRLETIFNSAGQEVPYRNSVDTEFAWKGGADVRLPLSNSLTFTFAYDRVETDHYFKRQNTIGGDMYKEHRQMEGYSYSVGVRLYLNK